MIDPHVARMQSEYSEEGFGQERYEGFGMGQGFEGMDFRVNRLYQILENKGDFAMLDKAKRNEHYRDYLLENLDELDDGLYQC